MEPSCSIKDLIIAAFAYLSTPATLRECTIDLGCPELTSTAFCIAAFAAVLRALEAEVIE
jgi:hypothetical protein